MKGKYRWCNFFFILFGGQHLKVGKLSLQLCHRVGHNMARRKNASLVWKEASCWALYMGYI